MFDGPDNAASFHNKQSSLPLRIEGSAADVSDEPHRAIWPVLFKRSANSMNASRYAWNGRQPSTTASQLGKTNIRGAVSSARLAHDYFHGWRKLELESFLRREVVGWIRSVKSRKNLR